MCRDSELSAPDPRAGRHGACVLLYNGLLAVAVFGVLILDRIGMLPQRQTGFYCGDPSISLPYTGDSIPEWVLGSVTALTPLLVLAAIEFCRYRPVTLSPSNACFKAMLQNVYTLYRDYSIVYVFNLLFASFAKSLVGEPRPHFMETCRPDTGLNCTRGEYVVAYRCTAAHNLFYAGDSNKSFPSVHAAMSFYWGIFLVCYLQTRGAVLRPRLLAPTLQALVVLWTMSCSLTRISDHRHHWWDVLVGAALGALSGYYVVAVICKKFACAVRPLPADVKLVNGDRGEKCVISLSNISKEETELVHP